MQSLYLANNIRLIPQRTLSLNRFLFVGRQSQERISVEGTARGLLLKKSESSQSIFLDMISRYELDC